MQHAEPVGGPAGGNRRHPFQYVVAARVGYPREQPYLDKHRPRHRHRGRWAAKALAKLGEDGANETPIEAPEGGLVPLAYSPDKIA